MGTVTNDRGGKQSEIKGQATELPPLALVEVSRVMQEGQEAYPREPDGTPNWHKISCLSNLDHCLEHAFEFLVERNKSDRDENKMQQELSHTAARALMALEQFLREGL